MSNPSNEEQQVLEPSTTILTKLGRVSQQRRETLGLSIAQLSDYSNIPRADLTLFEEGNLDIDVLLLYTLAGAMSTTSANIFEEAEGNPVVVPFKK